MRGKLWLLALVLIGGGIGLVYMGSREILHNRKLAAEGKPARATVLSKRERPFYKDNRSLHVTVAFQTETGQKIQDELMVTANVYQNAAPGESVDVLYYPKDPSIFIISRVANINYTKFGMGWVFLGTGLFVFWHLKKNPGAGVIKTATDDDLLKAARPIATKGAQNIVQQLAPLIQAKHKFETVDAKRFSHLDLKFYDSTRRFLEAKGFAHLEDFEDVTLRNSVNNPNTFIRAMLSSDGYIMAATYHFRPSLLLRVGGVKEIKVLDLETQFSNGHFVCTSNAEDSGKLNQPATVCNLVMPHGTSQAMLLTMHEQRIAQFIEKTGAQAVRMKNMADVRQAQEELQRLKAEHRRGTGLSREELERLGAKKGDRAADLMFEEVVKEHNRVHREKPSEPVVN